jgi:hypothetical protein
LPRASLVALSKPEKNGFPLKKIPLLSRLWHHRPKKHLPNQKGFFLKKKKMALVKF